MSLLTGPSRMAPELVQAPGLVLSALSIILPNRPFPPLAAGPRPIGPDRLGASLFLPFTANICRRCDAWGIGPEPKESEKSMSNYYVRLAAQERIQAERRVRQWRRDQERRDREQYEAHSSDVVRPSWGMFPDGRPYVDDRLPWASYDPTTREVVIDEAVAASYGVRARYDDATLSVVLGGF